MPPTGGELYPAWRLATDLDPRRVRGRSLDWDRRPAPHKDYPDAPRGDLPRHAAAAGAPLAGSG